MSDLLKRHEEWLISFYQARNWYDFSTLIRLNFLTGEVGELNQAIRSLELGRDHPGEKPKAQAELQENIQEELADCFDQLLIIAHKYGIKPQQLINQSETKLKNRFNLSD